MKVLFVLLVVAAVVVEDQENKTAVLPVIYTSPKRPRVVDTLSCAAAFIGEVLMPKHWEIRLNVTFVDNSLDRSGVVLYKAARVIRNATTAMGLLEPQNELLYYYLFEMEVPYFSSLSIDPQLKHKLELLRVKNLKENINDQVDAMLSAISSMRRDKVAILCCCENYYRYAAQKIYATVSKYGISIELQRTVTEQQIGHVDVHQLLLEFQERNNGIIMVLCPEDIICAILKQTPRNNMRSGIWAWFLFRTETDNFRVVSCSSVHHFPINVFGLHPTLRQNVFWEKILSKCASNVASDPVTIRYIGSLCLFANGFQPLVSRNSVLQSASSSNRWNNFKVENCLAAKNNTYEILHIQKDEIKTIGTWNKQTCKISGDFQRFRLSKGKTSLFSKQKRPRDVLLTLKNHVLNVVTVSSSPFVIIEHERTTSTAYSGFSFELFKEIQKRLGFSYRVRASPSGKFGLRNPVSGLWDGLIGDLLAGKADVVVAALTVTPEREQAVDFTKTYFETNVKYIVNVHATDCTLNKYGGYTFAQPYSISLWLSIFGTAVAMGLYLTFMSKLSPYGAYGHYFQSEEAEASNVRLERRRSSFASNKILKRSSKTVFSRRSLKIPVVDSKDYIKEMDVTDVTLSGSERATLQSRVTYLDDSTTAFLPDDEDSEDEQEERRNAQRQMSLSNSLYFAFAAMLWQSPESVPRAPSTRIPAAVWYMIGVIFVATYTATLVAFVSQTTESSTLLNLRGLVTQRRVQVGTVQGSSINELIMSSDLKIAEKVQEAILRNPAKAFQPSQNAALQLVKKGQLAFIWDGAILNYIARKSKCQLITVDLGFAKSSYSFALRKDSPFTDHINRELEKLQEEGFLKQLVDKYFGESDKCDIGTDQTRYADAPLKFNSLSGVFGMLVIAAIESLVVLGLEWVVASAKDVDRGDPRKPATFGRAIYLRWQRMLKDAKRNWLPFKRFRRHLWQNWSTNKNVKQRKYRSRLPGGIEKDQWKRYTCSSDAIHLRPGLSISNPSIHDQLPIAMI